MPNRLSASNFVALFLTTPKKVIYSTTNEIKRGLAVNYNGKLLLVKDIDIQAPSARGASTLYKMRFTDIKTVKS